MHWINTYPHEIKASVILQGNKILYWKIGQHSLADKYNIKALIEIHPECDFREKTFEANNEEEHNRIFEVGAIHWFRQWKLHENFTGDNPFEDNIKVGDIVGDRYEITEHISHNS